MGEFTLMLVVAAECGRDRPEVFPDILRASQQGWIFCKNLIIHNIYDDKISRFEHKIAKRLTPFVIIGS